MKAIIILFIFPICLFSQTHDSTIYVIQNAKPCIIIYTYNGVQLRDTLTAEMVSAWIRARGLSENDTTKVIQQGLLSHLRTEINRCYGNALVERQKELSAIDPDNYTTFAEFKVARQAVILKYRQYTWSYTVQVPNLP